MSDCPCGLTREELLAAPSQSLQPGMVCIAHGPDGNQCGRRLADHPRAPPGKNILLLYFFFSPL